MIQDIVLSISNGNDNLCRSHLRIQSRSFQTILNFIPNKRHGWEKEIELTIFLFWLACGTSYRVISVTANIPKTSVFRICKNYLRVFHKLLPRVIRFPTQEELQIVGEKFAIRSSTNVFRHVVGSIDGTHIKIKCPVAQHSAYINKKLDYSIQMQGIIAT